MYVNEQVKKHKSNHMVRMYADICVNFRYCDNRKYSSNNNNNNNNNIFINGGIVRQFESIVERATIHASNEPQRKKKANPT